MRVFVQDFSFESGALNEAHFTLPSQPRNGSGLSILQFPFSTFYRNSGRRDLLIINLRTDNSGLQVHHDSPGNMLPGSGLGEESVETVVSGSDGLVRRHLDNYTC